MTDDFNAVIELSKYLSTHRNYTITYLPAVQNRHGHNQAHWNAMMEIMTAQQLSRNASVDIKVGVAELMTEFEIMRKANYAVCSYYSSVCAVIQMLRHQPPETLIDVGNVGWSVHKIWQT